MNVGFTGTRLGMTEHQRESFARLMTHLMSLSFNYELSFHHGDCVGADADAHAIVLNCPLAHIFIHPPTEDKYRAFCTRFYKRHDPRPYLDRNRDIVNASSLMIATPDGEERLHSGTWSTIRYATRERKTVYVIEPSGKVSLFLPSSKK